MVNSDLGLVRVCPQPESGLRGRGPRGPPIRGSLAFLPKRQMSFAKQNNFGGVRIMMGWAMKLTLNPGTIPSRWLYVEVRCGLFGWGALWVVYV